MSFHFRFYIVFRVRRMLLSKCWNKYDGKIKSCLIFAIICLSILFALSMAAPNVRFPNTVLFRCMHKSVSTGPPVHLTSSVRRVTTSNSVHNFGVFLFWGLQTLCKSVYAFKLVTSQLVTCMLKMYLWKVVYTLSESWDR